MDARDDASHGWPLRDALNRLVTTNVLSGWESLERAVSNVSYAPSRDYLIGGLDALGASHAADGERTRIRVALRQARDAVLAELKDLGRRRLIVGFGRPEHRAAEPIQIPADRWVGFTDFNEATSILGDGPSWFFSVLVYPVLHAPDALERVAGKMLLDILCDFVLRDPEIENLYVNLDRPLPPNPCNVVGNAGDGACLVPVSDSAGVIEEALRQISEFQGDGVLATLPDRVLGVLASRIAGLGGLLIGDAVSARAVAEGDNGEAEIALSASDLRKGSCRLCLATGDIWQEKDGRKVRLYHSVRVERIGKRPPTQEMSDAFGETSKKNRGGRPVDPSILAAFDSVLVREFEAVGHDFESATRLARSLTEEWAKLQNEQLSDTARERKAKTMGDWLKRNFPDIWDMCKNGPLDPRKSK